MRLPCKTIPLSPIFPFQLRCIVFIRHTFFHSHYAVSIFAGMIYFIFEITVKGGDAVKLHDCDFLYVCMYGL